MRINVLIGAPSTLAIASPAGTAPTVRLRAGLPLGAALLAAVPVFLQAPWVRHAPFSAALFTLFIVAAGLGLERCPSPAARQWGSLLVGFAGSWLGGALFWGWFRDHPICHVPIEAVALPMAIGGLATSERWRLASAFYLSSLLGTACTDAAISSLGLMDYWPAVLAAPMERAPQLLRAATDTTLQPGALLAVAPYLIGLVLLCRQWRFRGLPGQVAAATLATTLAVDGAFWLAARMAPHLSGLI